MKKIIVILVLFLVGGYTIFMYVMDSNNDPFSEGENIGLEVGNYAPDFELETLDGGEARLSDFKGQKVIVNFWATWCPPCRAEMPDFEDAYVEDDVEILAVNLTESESNEGRAQDFIDELELTFPILMDRKSDISEMFNVMTYPTTYIVDSEGMIRFRAYGAINLDIIERELAMID